MDAGGLAARTNGPQPVNSPKSTLNFDDEGLSGVLIEYHHHANGSTVTRPVADAIVRPDVVVVQQSQPHTEAVVMASIVTKATTEPQRQPEACADFTTTANVLMRSDRLLLSESGR